MQLQSVAVIYQGYKFSVCRQTAAPFLSESQMDSISRTGINESNQKLTNYKFQQEFLEQIFSTSEMLTMRNVKLLREGITASGRMDAFTVNAYIKFCNFYLRLASADSDDGTVEEFIVCCNCLCNVHWNKKKSNKKQSKQVANILGNAFILYATKYYNWVDFNAFFYKWHREIPTDFIELGICILNGDEWLARRIAESLKIHRFIFTY